MKSFIFGFNDKSLINNAIKSGIVLVYNGKNQRIIMNMSIFKYFTILLFTICGSSAKAQLYFCIFDNPETDNLTASIPSDKIVNEYGDLVKKDYKVENEVSREADLVKRFYYNGATLIAQRNYTINGELSSDEAGIAIQMLAIAKIVYCRL